MVGHFYPPHSLPRGLRQVNVTQSKMAPSATPPKPRNVHQPPKGLRQVIQFQTQAAAPPPLQEGGSTCRSAMGGFKFLKLAPLKGVHQEAMIRIIFTTGRQQEIVVL